MQFSHHCETAGRNALDIIEALDDIQLPERSGTVEGARVQARHLDAKLSPVAGFWQRNMADMKFGVE